jgi:hypothetical protein
MIRIVSTLVCFIAAVIITLSACSSGKAAFERGNYYQAVLTSVNQLRRNPGHKKSSETLRAAYPLAVSYYEGQASSALASNVQFKWTQVVNSYTTLNQMGDEIRRSPGALAVIPNPANYSAKLNEARQNAAEEQYQAGIMALGAGTRDKAKEAYQYFKKAIEFVANYKDANQKMQDALWAATVKVLVEPMPTQSRDLAVSTDYFNAKLSEYLHQNKLNDYVKFYTPAETQQLKLYPDHIVRLEFDEYSVGNVFMSEKEIPLQRDSVVINKYYTSSLVNTPVNSIPNNTVVNNKTTNTQNTNVVVNNPAAGNTQTNQTSSNTPTTNTSTNTNTNSGNQNSNNTVTTNPSTNTNQTTTTNTNQTQTSPANTGTNTNVNTNTGNTSNNTTNTNQSQNTNTGNANTNQSQNNQNNPPANANQSNQNQNTGNNQSNQNNADNSNNNQSQNNPPANQGNQNQNAGNNQSNQNSNAGNNQNQNSGIVPETIPTTDQITICHVPQGNPAARHTLTISRSALTAHLEHGDFEGACDDPRNAAKLKELDKKAAEQKKNDNKTNDNKGNDKGNDKKGNGGGMVQVAYKQPILIASASNDVAWQSLMEAETITYDTVKVYGTVKATLYYYAKTVTSRGVVNFSVIDTKTNAVLSVVKIPAEYVWRSEWGFYNGDGRALTPQQMAITRNREQMPPTNDEMFRLLTEPVFQQVTQKIRDFYKNY